VSKGQGYPNMGGKEFLEKLFKRGLLGEGKGRVDWERGEDGGVGKERGGRGGGGGGGGWGGVRWGGGEGLTTSADLSTQYSGSRAAMSLIVHYLPHEEKENRKQRPIKKTLTDQKGQY